LIRLRSTSTPFCARMPVARWLRPSYGRSAGVIRSSVSGIPGLTMLAGLMSMPSEAPPVSGDVCSDVGGSVHHRDAAAVPAPAAWA
jgi:hypothetical protein